MSTPSLSPAREALDRLQAITDGDGSPPGPTDAGAVGGEPPEGSSPTGRDLLDDLLEELRRALGIGELSDRAVSFSEWIHDGEERYRLSYRLSRARPIGRGEELFGQIDAGKSLTLTRRLDTHQDPEDGGYEAEIYEARELESGAKIKDTTVWNEAQLGPLKARAIAKFFQPAIECIKEGAHRD